MYKNVVDGMIFLKGISDKNLYWDYRISIGVVLYFIMSVFNATIKTVRPDSGIVSILSILSGLVIAAGFIQCLPSVLKRSRRILFSSYILFFVVYGISMALISIRGESIDLMLKGSAFLTFAWWIPLGVFVSSIYDKSVLYQVFLRASFIILTLLTLMFIYHPLPENGVAGYNMFFGFNMLIPTLFHINELYKTKKLIYLFLFLTEFLMILVYANRGCLLPIVFIFLYKSLWENKKRTKKLLPIILILLIVIYFLGNILIETIASILEGYGLSSRTLWYLLSGDISNATGRDEIWNNSIKMISERPILGWGLGGEYYQLAAYEGAIEIDNSFTPHNGVLQNWVNFGVLIGSVVSIMIIRPYLNMRHIKDKYYHDLVLIFGSAIVAMFYSASGFFTNPMAAMFLYLSYLYSKRKTNFRIV